METLYQTFVKPYEQDYYLMGAIIGLIGILGIVFEGHIALNFLIGVPLFFLSMLFFNLLFKIHIESSKNKKFTIWMFFYEILFSVFVIAFFLAAYSKYPNPYGIFTALFFSFILLRVVILLRGYFVIFQGIFKKRWFKVVLRVIFLILLIFLWGIINVWVISKFDMYSFATKINSKGGISLVSAGEWSYYIFLMSNALFFAIACLMSFIDLFKKEPLGYKNLVWEKSRLYNLLKWFKEGKLKIWWQNFYSNNLE